MIKTPVPQECLLTPPHLLIKIVGIVLQINQPRDYSTNSKFQRSQAIFTQNKRYLWPIFKSTGLLISAAVTADLGVATMGGETAYSTRSLDKNRYGWFTNSPKARERYFFSWTKWGRILVHLRSLIKDWTYKKFIPFIISTRLATSKNLNFFTCLSIFYFKHFRKCLIKLPEIVPNSTGKNYWQVLYLTYKLKTTLFSRLNHCINLI